MRNVHDQKCWMSACEVAPGVSVSGSRVSHVRFLMTCQVTELLQRQHPAHWCLGMARASLSTMSKHAHCSACTAADMVCIPFVDICSSASTCLVVSSRRQVVQHIITFKTQSGWIVRTCGYRQKVIHWRDFVFAQRNFCTVRMLR